MRAFLFHNFFTTALNCDSGAVVSCLAFSASGWFSSVGEAICSVIEGFKGVLGVESGMFNENVSGVDSAASSSGMAEKVREVIAGVFCGCS